MKHSLRKYKKAFFKIFFDFKKHRKKLSAPDFEKIKLQLQQFEQAILNQDKETCARLYISTEERVKPLLKKHPLRQGFELICALALALLVTLLIRQVWFELYEVPTGSMRPTIREQDRLGVSKLSFGINMPFRTEHLYFDPDLVLRNGIVTLTSENMGIRDADTRYFYLFPGKKQYVKRLIGKPGDVLYFYGGRIYGIDREDRDLSAELQLPSLSQIDHVPFMKFDGEVKLGKIGPRGVYPTAMVYQMNQPVATLSLSSERLQPQGKITSLQGIHDSQAPLPTEYGSLWGMNQFAMCRLLTKEQVLDFYGNALLKQLGEGVLYLELKHSPSFDYLKMGQDLFGRIRPVFILATSLIPLEQKQIERAFDSLYTARFQVKKGKMQRYSAMKQEKSWNSKSIEIQGIPDGCYEFYYGDAYQIGWQGISRKLSKNHPIYLQTPERLLLWFNLGIEFHERFAPTQKDQLLTPSRYAYFRDGSLHLMGGPVWQPEDPTLKAFVEREGQKMRGLVLDRNPLPFLDSGAPLLEGGKLDVQKIKAFGLRIPEKQYLVLGDNFAMSADSRDFGFVPEGNLRGAPSEIFWPPGSRFGHLNQAQYPLFTSSRVLVWSMAAVVIVTLSAWNRRRRSLPIHWDKLD